MHFKYNILFQEVGDTYIGVAVGDDAESFPSMLTFNETGYNIARRLQTDITREKLISLLLEEYDVDEQTLGAYVDEVLTYLSNNHVI